MYISAMTLGRLSWCMRREIAILMNGIAAPYGFGKHIDTLSTDDIKTFLIVRMLPAYDFDQLNTDSRFPRLKSDYVFSHFYNIALASVKLSILLFYHRIFTLPMWFRRTVQVMIVCVVLWVTVMEILFGLECRPIQKWWDSTRTGECLDLVAFTYATNTVNLTSDLLIFVLPIPVILRLQTTRNRKIGLISLFSMGLMCVLPRLNIVMCVACAYLVILRVCAVSCYRLSMVFAQASADFTCKLSIHKHHFSLSSSNRKNN
jgi:hypothetical protein